MLTVKLWVLIWWGMHSYPTVSGIASKDECERLYREIRTADWAKSELYQQSHICLGYEGARP